MDTGLTISVTEDKAEIMQVLKCPEIYQCITGDDSPPAEEFDMDLDGYEFVVGKVSGNVMGLMVFYADKPGWYCHVQVLPEYRKDYALEYGKKCLEWFWDTHDTNELFAEIPDKYPNVQRFASKNRFKPISILDDVYIKDGVSYNKMRYRLERPHGVC